MKPNIMIPICPTTLRITTYKNVLICLNAITLAVSFKIFYTIWIKKISNEAVLTDSDKTPDKLWTDSLKVEVKSICADLLVYLDLITAD